MAMWKVFSTKNAFFIIDGEDMCEHQRLKIINSTAEELFPLGTAFDMALTSNRTSQS